MEATFVVVGGGISGVSTTETLSFLEPLQSIILISESSLIKTVTNLHAITKTITSFDVVEAQATSLNQKYSNVTVIHDSLMHILDKENTIVTKNKLQIKYTFLCLCVGAQPKLLPQATSLPYVLGIRDTDSVDNFVKILENSKRVAIVGNGGIASEVVYKIQNADVHWIIKDNHITATFVDPGAAEFFQQSLNNKKETNLEPLIKRMRYEEDTQLKSGAALGPDWYKNLKIEGNNFLQSQLNVHYGVEVTHISKCENPKYNLEVHLSNNERLEVDLVVSATGVVPKLNFTSQSSFQVSEEGYLKVDEFLRTSLPNVYAAGDVCQPNWPLTKHWFPMKLWTQARQMGCYAAKAMSGHFQNEEVLQDFCFELFGHSTKLFGHKVILLGLFNGQKLGTNYEILLRMTKEKEYIKFVLENNKLQGAILIGDTDLEEMCENLILNQLDLSPYGDDILNPDIDIEDYFD